MHLFSKMLIMCVLAGTASAAKPDSDLQKQLESMIVGYPGKVALYATHLTTGARVAINADQPVQTASVIKLPIMLEAFYQAKSGKLDLNRRLALTKENQVPGSGVLQFMHPGLEPTVEDAITLMIDVSDNTATNLVIDAVGIPAVNQRLAEMGLKNTYLYKKVYKPAQGPMPPDQPKFGLGKTTAREMGEVMAAIQRCDLGERKLCDRMIEILRNQFYRESVPRYLETLDTTEKPSSIANKTGALDEVRNDVALVMSNAGPIVISAFTWDNKDQTWTPDNHAYLLIARMSKAIVQAWSPKGVKHAAGK